MAKTGIRHIMDVIADRPVVADDIIHLYAIFLGRKPESEEVVRRRVGGPLLDALVDFARADELRVWMTQASTDRGALPALLASPAADDVLRWVDERLGLSDLSDGAADTVLLLDVLVALTQQPSVTDRLATVVGNSRAARIGVDLAALARDIRVAAAPAQTAVPRDIYNLYLLVLGRTPEAVSAITTRQGQPLTEVLAGFLSSPEFSERLGAIGDGVQRLSASPLPHGLRAWAERAFALRLPAAAGAATALAALLRAVDPHGDRTIALADQPAVAMADILDAVAAANVPGGVGEIPFDELVRASGLFDADWYLASYDDVRASGADALDHFVHAGAAQCRDPGPGFDTAFYRATYPDASDFAGSAFEHYLQVGRAAEHRATPPSEYGCWIARFEELSAAHRDWIDRDAARRALPPAVRLHLGSDDEAAEQLGTVPLLHLIGQDDDAAREALVDTIPAGTTLVLSAGDVRLRPHACYCFCRALGEGADAVYSDHDHLDDDGERNRPVFKPELSPDLMARTPYAGLVIALRLHEHGRAAVHAALRRARRGEAAAAFADLLLSFDRRKVARLPLVLFSIPIGSSRYAGKSAEAAVIGRYEVQGTGSDPAIRLEADGMPPVSIIIPTRDRHDLLRDCVDSVVDHTDYPIDRVELVIVDNDSRDADSVAYLAELATRRHVQVIRAEGPFNFSLLCNQGVAASTGEIVVLLNNDTVVIDPEWLRLLAHHAGRREIGAVGAKLLFPDGTVQHGGIVLGVRGMALHRLLGEPAAPAAVADLTREMTAVTAACMAMRRSVFQQVGGFDPVLAIAFNDVDLCLRLAAAGYRTLYVAKALLYHHESKSRGADDNADKIVRAAREAIYVRQRHQQSFRNDPAYNPNLSFWTIGSLAMPPRVVPPWRRAALPLRLLLLIGEDAGGDIRPIVVAQARLFARSGWRVTIGGAIEPSGRDATIGQVSLETPEQAGCFALTEAVDCIISHSADFHAVAEILGTFPLVYLFDHGDRSSDPFVQEVSDLARRVCAPLARRLLVASGEVGERQFASDPIVLPPDTTALPHWTSACRTVRDEIRSLHGITDRFVILNARDIDDHEALRRLLELAEELRYSQPALAARAAFVLVGAGEAVGEARARACGFLVITGLSDERLTAMLAAADLYVDLSGGNRYDWGIARARAMGLPVVAADAASPRGAGIATAGSLAALCRLTARAFQDWQNGDRQRTAVGEGDEEDMTHLLRLLEGDVHVARAAPWL